MSDRKIIYADDAIDALNSKRVSEDNGHMWREYRNENVDMAIEIIKSLPPAQPEIIPCTECRYYDTDIEQCNNDKGLQFIDFGNPEHMWCPWAERREG